MSENSDHKNERKWKELKKKRTEQEQCHKSVLEALNSPSCRSLCSRSDSANQRFIENPGQSTNSLLSNKFSQTYKYKINWKTSQNRNVSILKKKFFRVYKSQFYFIESK